jgi:hypothetical protein
MFPGSPGDERPPRHLVPRILPRFFACIDDGGPALPNSGIPDPLGWCTVPNPLPVRESQYHCGYLSHSWERVEIQSAQLRIPMVIALTVQELVGSYLTQVHLQHQLESNDYDRSCQTTMYI